MMRNDPILIDQIEDRNVVKHLLDALYSGDTVTHAGFQCKVSEINVKEEGAKLYGTYKVVATVSFRLLATSTKGAFR